MIFAWKRRKPQQPQGQGIFSYGAANVRPTENIYPQAAPDPIRQGAVPARPARMQIANMGVFTYSNSGISDLFIPYGHELLPVHGINNTGLKPLIGHSGVNTERSNIRKPAAVAYGSLFEGV